MNLKDIPEGYAIVPWTVDGVYRFYIGRGLFYADNPKLGAFRGKMHAMTPIFDETGESLFKNTFEEALEYCRKHPRR